MKCHATPCARDAKTAVGVAIFQPKVVTDWLNTTDPLAVLTTSLCLCPPCFTDLEQRGVYHLVPVDDLKAFAREAEQDSGYFVELARSRFVRVLFSDPDYQALSRARERGAVGYIEMSRRKGEAHGSSDTRDAL